MTDTSIQIDYLPENTVEITCEAETSIELTQAELVSIDVEIATIGPKGEKGEKGDTGIGQQGPPGETGTVEELPIDPVLLFENALA